jgi:hydrogenase 3 maturation protease
MAETLDKLLSQKKKILFAGIGNTLRSDDGVGVYISRNIEERENIISITAETAIENYIGKINSLRPDVLVIIDCADMKVKPGTHTLLDINKIHDFTFNTHNISLKRLTGFFRMKVYILEIQPEKLDFGEKISYFVKKNADLIINRINEKEVCYGSRISV